MCLKDQRCFFFKKNLEAQFGTPLGRRASHKIDLVLIPEIKKQNLFEMSIVQSIKAVVEKPSSCSYICLDAMSSINHHNAADLSSESLGL